MGFCGTSRDFFFGRLEFVHSIGIRVKVEIVRIGASNS